MTAVFPRIEGPGAAVMTRPLLALLLFLAFAQCGCKNRFLFYPLMEIVATPADAGIEYEDVYFNAGDGVRLNAWWVPAQGARGTVLFCHGNGGNISFLVDTIRIYRSIGLNVFAFDYRGYGRSEGAPTEGGTYEDARGAWDYLVGVKKIDPSRIVLIGRSLGGPIAAWLAMTRRPGVLVLESTFTKASEVADYHYRFRPGRLVFGDTYDTGSYLGRVRSPVLVVHSPEDEIIPCRMGEELFAAAPSPKEFLLIRGSHNAGFIISMERYRNGLGSFAARYLR